MAQPDPVLHALSAARFAPYLAAAVGRPRTAVRLYWWNVEVSEAFHPALHLLEVATRNSLHAQLSAMFSRSDWWDAARLEPGTHRMVAEAEDKVRRRKPAGATTDDTVTELSFGFWASLVSRKYDRRLWVPGLYRAFPHHRGRRSELHQSLWTAVLLRNRIMHHEPIHHRHLVADRQSVYRLLGCLSPLLSGSLEGYDRLPEVLARRPHQEAGH